MVRILSFLFFLVFVLGQAAWAFEVSGAPVVVDGDTLRFGRGSDAVVVRLAGIDAPELRQRCVQRRDGKHLEIPCGEMAATRLRELIAGKTVSCRRVDTDRYGRMIGICFTGQGRDAVSLNEAMLRDGWAVVFRRTATEHFLALEAFARREQRGIWATDFESPDEWRRRRRER